MRYSDRGCGRDSETERIVDGDGEVYKKGERCVYDGVYGCSCCEKGCRY